MEEKMDLLSYLKKRQSELECKHHPLIKLDDTGKYLYCFGLGVMAIGNMKAITELQEYFDMVLDAIALPQKAREKIIVHINNYFELHMTECLTKLKSKELQYCFVLDLYKMYGMSLWSQSYCEGILENYLQIFYFSNSEREFFRDFSDAAAKKQVDRAINCYKKFKADGYDISYQIMEYFFPEFYIEEEYKDILVKAGETYMLDKPATINGNVKVERGGSLLVQGAILRVNGHIDVDGGRIRFRDARVQVTDCDRDYLMQLKNTAVVQIDASFFDCGSCCGLLSQDAGRLLISGTQIHRTSNARCISFKGMSLLMSRCEFHVMRAGAVELLGAARVLIEDCSFIDGRGDYGGAIFSETIANVSISRCHFLRCEAKYLGAAIYFKHRKFGQLVKECDCEECKPKEDMIFNVYEDDFEMKIR